MMLATRFYTTSSSTCQLMGKKIPTMMMMMSRNSSSTLLSSSSFSFGGGGGGASIVGPAAAARHMSSVVTLSDMKATEKFHIINHKSILYFTAVWCPPCKAIKPFYEELAEKYPSIAFGKVDVDDNNDAALEHQISAVPTFILFEGENAIERFSGADPNKLESLVSSLDER